MKQIIVIAMLLLAGAWFVCPEPGHAHGWYGSWYVPGAFVGGALFGAAIARPHAYPPPAYVYPAPIYGYPAPIYGYPYLRTVVLLPQL